MQQRVSFASQQWLLKRNCSLSPSQLAGCFGLLSLVSFSIACACAAQGAWPVVVFSCIEVAALVVAFLVYARHAGDYEKIVLEPKRLTIETMSGNEVCRRELTASWLRVELPDERRGLVRLVQGAQTLAVGRFLPEHERLEFARELRASLARANGA
jgi:uncharacterized membrane protein